VVAPVPSPVVGGRPGLTRILPVLAMTCGYSRVTDAVMIPSPRPATFWRGCGRSSAVGPVSAKPAVGAGSRDRRPRPVDRRSRVIRRNVGRSDRTRPPGSETNGLVERRNGYFETSFLPGRTFTSPTDFNIQPVAGRCCQRPASALDRGTGPDRRWVADRAATVELPPVTPAVGLTGRVRLGRDYYVRVGRVKWSV
jgi:hypothetical protein